MCAAYRTMTDILCQRCAAILAGVRADRLLALLAMLQARGKCTGKELARELEVSVRTVCRDIEALSAAGIPIWATGGPGGGCQLIEGWRSSLLQISTEEAMALLAAVAPAPVADTSIAEDLSAARLKLLAALPAARRAGVAAESARFYVDAPDWFRPLRPAPISTRSFSRSAAAVVCGSSTIEMAAH